MTENTRKKQHFGILPKEKHPKYRKNIRPRLASALKTGGFLYILHI